MVVRYCMDQIFGIYNFLKKNKISREFNNTRTLVNNLQKLFSNKTKLKNVEKKIIKTGNKILKSTYKEINFFLDKYEA